MSGLLNLFLSRQTTETDISGASCNICHSLSHRAPPSGLHNEVGLRKRRSCQAAALYNSRFHKFCGELHARPLYFIDRAKPLLTIPALRNNTLLRLITNPCWPKVPTRCHTRVSTLHLHHHLQVSLSPSPSGIWPSYHFEITLWSSIFNAS